jgi:integrase
MKKVENRLVYQQIKKLAPGTYCDGGGLYLRVTVAKNGEDLNRAYFFKYRLPNGRSRECGVGSAATCSLAEARDKAALLREMRRRGIDPIEERRQAKDAAPRVVKTFDECAEEYIASKCEEWRQRERKGGTKQNWTNSIARWVSPVIGSMDVAAIETPHVLSVFHQPVAGEDGSFWQRRTQTAWHVRGRIEHVLDWARVHGLRQGMNPALWRGNLRGALPSPYKIVKRSHRDSLSYNDLGAFLVELDKFRRNSALPPMVELIILTVPRVGELCQATWDEVDWTAKSWDRPTDHMKMERPHRIPLSPRAMEILKGEKEISTSSLIFPGPVTGREMQSSRPLDFITETMRWSGPKMTVHGLRATFKTWAAEKTNFDPMVIEAALAHKQVALEDAYQRGDYFDKRRVVMDRWADFLMKAKASALRAQRADSDNVVEMKIPA